MRYWIAAAIIVAAPAAAREQSAPTPLFASDAPIRITVQGPIGEIARTMAKQTSPRPATLNLSAPAETHAIMLSARGLSRRTGGICQFPPLRVELAQRPAATSLFAGQGRLKLVTHCRAATSFQQNTLLEYSAYRIFNLISPTSYRARLATVDYAEPSGKVSATRWGFFLEDIDDVARRNGLAPANVGDRILASQLEARQAARVALFEYMIGNLDWSMRAGPQGEGCCHNSRLLTGGGPALIPVPYDFDYSGLVDATYAIPPDGFSIKNVRQRVYVGYCRHNAEAITAAADFRALRPAFEAVFGQVPDLAPRTRAKAIAYLGTFFDQIATDDLVRSKVLKGCVA